jgi:hypothetical protein
MRFDKLPIDPRGRETSAALRTIGLTMVAVGGGLFLIGAVSFFSAFATREFPRYFWCAIVGLPVFGFGVQISGLGFLGAITRYMAGQTAPVQRDTFNYLADGTSEGVRTVASAAARGFAEGTGADPGVVCPQCQAMNGRDAHFCDQCGAGLDARTCPRCQHENDPGGRFCNQCGCELS